MIMAGWKDIRLIRCGKKFLSNFILNFFLWNTYDKNVYLFRKKRLSTGLRPLGGDTRDHVLLWGRE